MADCPACAAAAAGPHYEFHASCRGCCARTIARSPAFFEARSAGRQTPAYRELLRSVGGLHKPPVEHAEVRAAAEIDARAVAA